MIERFHRSLKTSLRCLSIKGDWVAALPMVLLGWRNTIHSASGTSPAKLLFGIGTSFPGEFFNTSKSIPTDALNTARQHFLDSDTNPSFGSTSTYKTYIPNSLFNSKYVWMQARDTYHMKPRYLGPFEVVSFHDNNNVTIIKDGKHCRLNIEKVKPAFGFDDPIGNTTNSTPPPPPDKVLAMKTPSPSSNSRVDSSPLPHTDVLNLPVPQPSTPNNTIPLQNLGILKSSKTLDPSLKTKKSLSFSRWARLCEPRRSKSLPFRYIRTKV